MLMFLPDVNSEELSFIEIFFGKVVDLDTKGPLG